MASFNNTVITDKGRSLMAKIVAGTATPQFTKIRTSDYQYPVETNFESLTSMNSVKQEVDVASVTKLDVATVKVSGAITNTGLESGYYVRNIGLYALDPTEGEILYSITPAIEADWMPPAGENAISSIMVDLHTTVENSDNVSLEVNPNAIATVQMINDVETELADLKDLVEGVNVEGKRTARFTVGTAQAGWTAEDVDYLCTGTDDQVQINDALNSLPAGGGEVVILDGIYNIEGAIHVTKDNTTLRGNGNATVLKRMYNSDATYTSNTARGLITLDNKKGCRIKDLYIDGNSYNYDSYNNYGISMTSSSDNTITNNVCSNNSYGIYLYDSSDNNTITGNICNNNDDNGIYLYDSINNTITGNTCNNNYRGIYLTFYSDNNTVTGNICNNNTSIDLRFSNTTNDNIVANNKGNIEDLGNNILIGASKRTARFTIGTTQSGWAAEDVDYLCTGTGDQVQINNALNALPADGGEIVILDGIYNIEGAIHVAKDNTTLRGSGNATVLKRMYNSTAVDEGNTARGLITLNDKKGCKIKNLHIDGNKDNYDFGDNCGIFMVSSSDNAISNNTCGDNGYGIYLNFSSSNTITGNNCNGNNNRGIFLIGSSSDNTITGNTCNNNDYGIYLGNDSNSNIIIGNTCNNNNDEGIELYSSSGNAVTDNVCNNNSNGIYLDSSSDNNTVTGNIFNNNNRGIFLYSSSSNAITGNICSDNNNSIYLTSSSSNAITGNICSNNENGIYLFSSSNYNCVAGNVLVDNITAYFSDGGTENIEANNVKKNRE